MEELICLLGSLVWILLAYKPLKVRLLICGLTPICEPFLGSRKTGPSREVGSQIDGLPLWVTRCLVKLAEFGVQSGPDKFLNTDLAKILKDKGIQTVIVTGTASNGAVLFTGARAAFRGMNVIVPVDGMSAVEPYNA